MRAASILLALVAGCEASIGGDDPRDATITPPLDAAIPAVDAPRIAPDAPVPRGFRAEYFAGYVDLALERVEPSVAHAWGDAAPDPALPADRFSARFAASLVPPASGTYRFVTENDDGVRLWVGDVLVIDDWRGHYPERHEGTIDLIEGAPVAIRLDYFEIDLGAEIALSWAPPGQSEQPLGPEHVTPAIGPGLPAPRAPYTNPVIGFDCPDPGVLADGDAFYAVCTGGAFPIRRSRDLVRWEDTGASILPFGVTGWSANGHRNWAPELHRVGDRVIAYFTAVNGANVLSIGAAWADDPLGPYTVLDHPLVEHGDGAIDANYFRDDDRRHYLFYKIDGNAHGRATPILVRELAADGLSFVGDPHEVLRNDPSTWEGGVVEATWTVRRDGTYYLFYSGNVYDGRYRTGVARSASVLGPYERHGAPILRNDARWVGPGHGSVVRVSDEDWLVYHAWNATAGGGHDGSRGRFGLLDRIVWEGGWPRIADGTPSDAPLRAPGSP